MFKQRLLSGIILVLVAIGAIYFGGYVLWGVLLLISLIGMFEINRVFKSEKSAVAVLSYLSAIGYYVLILLKYEDAVRPAFLLLAPVFLIVFVIGYPKYTVTQIMAAFFSVFYVAVLLCCIYRIRILDGGAYLTWLVFLGAWGSDTCAYCVGKLIGKHKAFPVLSPKKSVEGCIGGVVGAALIGLGFAAAFQSHLNAIGNPLVALPLIAACASILSQFGDLAASGIKRQHEIKDYGTLIPGHGGVMDRFDSVIFTAPAVYLLLVTFFMNA